MLNYDFSLFLDRTTGCHIQEKIAFTKRQNGQTDSYIPTTPKDNLMTVFIIFLQNNSVYRLSKALRTAERK